MTTPEASARLNWLIADASKGDPHFHQWHDKDRQLFQFFREMLDRGQKMPQKSKVAGAPLRATDGTLLNEGKSGC